MSILLKKEFLLPAMGELHLWSPLTRDVSGVQVTLTVYAPEERVDDGKNVVAEVFGAECPLDTPMVLPPGRGVTLLSPSGCRCVVEAPATVLQEVYATSGPSTYQRNTVLLHQHLETLRSQARQQEGSGIGPRVLICGSIPSSGKSALCRTLANYAVRLGYHPLYCDADMSLPQLGYPGCLNLFVLQYVIDCVEEGSFFPGLHFAVGQDKASGNPLLWRHVLRHVMSTVEQRASRSERCRYGGLFVDYPTMEEELLVDGACLVEEDSGVLADLFAAMELLDIDTVVVLGSELLRFRISQYADKFGGGPLRSLLSAPSYRAASGLVAAPSASLSIVQRCGTPVQLLPFPPSACSGAPRGNSIVEFQRQKRWIQYFGGTITSPLRPTMLNELPVSFFKLVQIGGVSRSEMGGLLPMDEEVVQSDPAMVSYIQPGDLNLAGVIVAISSATFLKAICSTDANGDTVTVFEEVPVKQYEAKLKELCVVGFASIRAISPSTITLLIPAPALPQARGLCLIVMNAVLPVTSSK